LSPKLKRRGLIVLAVCSAAFLSGTLLSNETLMSKLPVYDRYQCALCHTSADPAAGDAELNAFGRDFHLNGDRWDATLAAKDSDGDGFKNGLELGDDEGDGIPNISKERSNPGDGEDKPSSVDEKSWGIIKKLFDDDARRMLK
jgi:hypothetical protein